MFSFRRTLAACSLLIAAGSALAQDNLNVARYDNAGLLTYPADLYAWIQTAASVGSAKGKLVAN